MKPACVGSLISHRNECFTRAYYLYKPDNERDYVPADDLTDPATATTFAHLDTTTVLSRNLASKGIYPAVDPLDSTSTMLQPEIVGDVHYSTAQRIKETLQRYKELQDIIAILGLDELSEEDRQVIERARKVERFLSKPSFVAEVFTGSNW